MQFVGTMPAMIEIAGLLSAVLGSWVDFWIIFALLMTNATLGFIEEMNAQASIAALKDGMIRKLPVKRDGKFTPLNVIELVPGDVVFLRGGNVIPADGKTLARRLQKGSFVLYIGGMAELFRSSPRRETVFLQVPPC